MAKVYTVEGSEDGILGVYANKRAAIKKAHDYATLYGEREVEDSFENYLNELKNTDKALIWPKEGTFAEAQVEAFELER